MSKIRGLRPEYRILDLLKDFYLENLGIEPYPKKHGIRYLLAWNQAEEAVSYPTWTLLPNSNSMKIRLKPMQSRNSTPNPILISQGYKNP